MKRSFFVLCVPQCCMASALRLYFHIIPSIDFSVYNHYFKVSVPGRRLRKYTSAFVTGDQPMTLYTGSSSSAHKAPNIAHGITWKATRPEDTLSESKPIREWIPSESPANSLLGRIVEKDIGKLRASAPSIPMQRCQRWTVEVLGSLERKGLVPVGTTNRFAAQVEPARAARTSGRSRLSGGSDFRGERSSGRRR